MDNDVLSRAIKCCRGVAHAKVGHAREHPPNGLFKALLPRFLHSLKLLYLYLHGSTFTENDIKFVAISTDGLEDVLISTGGRFPVRDLGKLTKILQSIA